jgi:glycosyltransferase involved in cell wall biosynthesis
LKVLFLNSVDNGGGAANAAYRLFRGVRDYGIESQLLVQSKMSTDNEVLIPKIYGQRIFSFLNPLLDTIPVRFYRKRPLLNFSTGLLPDFIKKSVSSLAPDIIHLHWVAQSFAGITTIKHFKRPIVWTLHDFWPFTGGCHYPETCEGYRDFCGRCPILGSARTRDLSWVIMKKKQVLWQQIDLTLVAPSQWIGNCARQSSLFKNFPIEIIPNGLDLHKFKQVNKAIARELLGLPLGKKLILFGAKVIDDPRKGFKLLTKALQRLDNNLTAKTELILFGNLEGHVDVGSSMQVRNFGSVSDETTLVLLLSAADVFAAPSIQENLANTVMEALACGTPCVAFDIGGMPDMIDHYINGYLASPFDVDDLAKGIQWILTSNEQINILADNARKKVENNFSNSIVIDKYVKLYEKVLRA